MVLTADDFSRLTKYIKRRRIGGRAVCTTVGNCCALLVKCAAQPLVSVGSRLVRFGMPGARLNGERQLISLAPNLTRCYFLDLAPWVQIEGACADDGCLVPAARDEHFQRAWRSLTLLRSLKRKMHSVGDWLDVTKRMLEIQPLRGYVEATVVPFPGDDWAVRYVSVCVELDVIPRTIVPIVGRLHSWLSILHGAGHIWNWLLSAFWEKQFGRKFPAVKPTDQQILAAAVRGGACAFRFLTSAARLSVWLRQAGKVLTPASGIGS